MLAGMTAVELARAVRSREASPVEVVGGHLELIAALDGRIGAFEAVREKRALAEAEELAGRADIADLPLAGVPVAIKANLSVAGEVHSPHSRRDPSPSDADHEVVRRLRAAGAIIVGLTRIPQLTIWGTSDCPCGVARNPWHLDRTAGGSSGGSAAAVAAGFVPIAVGNDGMGSIRVPAAACGLFGIKPGSGSVPAGVGPSNWRGLTENGPLASTVADARLALSVMAEDAALATPSEAQHPLRIAVSTKSPLAGLPVDRVFKAAVEAAADLLRREGHSVRVADPPYSVATANAVVAWWGAAVAEEADGIARDRLERRARGHIALGRLAQKRGWVKAEQRERWQRRVGDFFSDFDALLTPALARRPPAAGPWRDRSWLANLLSNAAFAPFAAPWNFAGYPAASVPVGMHPKGTPLAIQIVAPPRAEDVILRLAAVIENAQPWPRHAPL